MTKAVLFDLDGTLLDRANSLFEFLERQHARFAERLGAAGLTSWRSRFLALDQSGLVHKSVVYKALLSEFGGDPSACDALLHDYQHRCCEHARGFPGMARAFSALREKGLRLGIVTNGETAFQMRNVRALGLERLAVAILVSETEGLRKPGAALFQRAADRLQMKPDQCLFVGDNPAADILGAHGAGMRTAWFSGGSTWPIAIAPNPGAEITALLQVLALV